MELITDKQEQAIVMNNRLKMKRDYVTICENNKEAGTLIRENLRKSGFRLVARVPLAAVTIHQETRKYFDPMADQHEFKKDTTDFLNKFPEFKV